MNFIRHVNFIAGAMLVGVISVRAMYQNPISTITDRFRAWDLHKCANLGHSEWYVCKRTAEDTSVHLQERIQRDGTYEVVCAHNVTNSESVRYRRTSASITLLKTSGAKGVSEISFRTTEDRDAFVFLLNKLRNEHSRCHSTEMYPYSKGMRFDPHTTDEHRKGWTLGSKIEIRSYGAVGARQWYEGEVVKTYKKNDEEYIQVQYSSDNLDRQTKGSRMKDLKRYSPDLRVSCRDTWGHGDELRFFYSGRWNDANIVKLLPNGNVRVYSKIGYETINRNSPSLRPLESHLAEQVEVYSETHKKWFIGRITWVYGRDIKVIYSIPGENYTMKVTLDKCSENLRPLQCSADNDTVSTHAAPRGIFTIQENESH